MGTPGEASVATDTSTSLSMRLGVSRQLTLVLGALYVGAVACVSYADLPIAARTLVSVWVLFAGLRCLALHAFPQAACAIVLVAWDQQGQWRLVQRNGVVLDAWLEHGAYSHPALLVLPFRLRDGHRRRVLVVPDRVQAGVLRRIRVRLRCKAHRSP